MQMNLREYYLTRDDLLQLHQVIRSSQQSNDYDTSMIRDIKVNKTKNQQKFFSEMSIPHDNLRPKTRSVVDKVIDHKIRSDGS
jgi:hypothetical protein